MIIIIIHHFSAGIICKTTFILMAFHFICIARCSNVKYGTHFNRFLSKVLFLFRYNAKYEMRQT